MMSLEAVSSGNVLYFLYLHVQSMQSSQLECNLGQKCIQDTRCSETPVWFQMWSFHYWTENICLFTLFGKYFCNIRIILLLTLWYEIWDCTGSGKTTTEIDLCCPNKIILCSAKFINFMQTCWYIVHRLLITELRQMYLKDNGDTSA